MLKRKFRKLVNNPKLFFSDMAIKHSDKISYLKPKKMEGSHQYTVVSAVYNVGRYLDDYFNSLVKQRLDFKKHITLILVDDGSTDNSAEIIQRWQQKYPNNIKYIYKENGGQASARNLGIKHVTTEWVTFIDPDDFVELDYFLEVDRNISKNTEKRIDFISCNLIFYYEDTNQFSDSHPLNFKYSEDIILPISNIKNRFQLSASSAFFRKSVILSSQISFDSRVKPNFEDGKFISEYMINSLHGNISYIRGSRYIYRKRSDGSSTLDKSWTDSRRFDDVLIFGYLDVIKKSIAEQGFLPDFIQNAILYDLIWHIKRFVNSEGKLSFLNQQEKSNYVSLLKEIFSYIDDKVILDFNLAGCWFYHKVGILGLFKDNYPKQHIVYIDGYDSSKNLVHFYYHSKSQKIEEILVNGVDTTPTFEKSITHDFIGNTFTIERRLWCKITESGTIKVYIAGKEARLSLLGNQYSNGISINKIVDAYKKNKSTGKYSGAWLFMDRDTQADDNAEHLYRYIKNNNLKDEIFFILRKNSHDWGRLNNDGFNLIEFGSSQHELALISCDKIISSHADRYVTNYLSLIHI